MKDFSKNRIAGIVFLIVVALLVIYTYQEVSKDGEGLDISATDSIVAADRTTPFQHRMSTAEAETYRDQGDYRAAALIFEEVAENTGNSYERGLALARAGVTNFLIGAEVSQQEGIEQLKEVIEISDDAPHLKARAIADLASLVCGSGCDPVVFEMVFAGEPYRSYRTGEDMPQSVARLYEWAVSVSPRHDALVRLMSWHAEQIFSNFETLSDTELQEHTDAIMGYASDPNSQWKGFTQEEMRGAVSHYFWRGYAFGALTMFDQEEYGKTFESLYQRSIELGGGYAPGSNVNYAVLFAYYQYATLLDHLYGDARADDVESLLSRLMESVDADPGKENNQFLLMVENELKRPGIQHGFIGTSIYRLSERYPIFAAFLREYGLVVE